MKTLNSLLLVLGLLSLMMVFFGHTNQLWISGMALAVWYVTKKESEKKTLKT